jgi:hypothetical protein
MPPLAVRCVAELLVSTLERLDPKLPEPDPGVDASEVV